MKYLILLLFFIGRSVIATEPQGDQLQANTSENNAVNEVLEIKISGTTRQYRLFIPSGLSKPEAILFDFHGSANYPEQHLGITNMQKVAEDLQALLVLPKAAALFPEAALPGMCPTRPNTVMMCS